MHASDFGHVPRPDWPVQTRRTITNWEQLSTCSGGPVELQVLRRKTCSNRTISIDVTNVYLVFPKANGRVGLSMRIHLVVILTGDSEGVNSQIFYSINPR